MVVLLCTGATLQSADAHDPGMSSATVTVGIERASAVVVFAASDLISLGEFDRNGDGRLNSEEIAQAKSELEAVAGDALALRMDGIRAAASVVAITVVEAGEEIVMRIDFALPNAVPAEPSGIIEIRSPLAERLPYGHRVFVRLLNEDGTVLHTQLLDRSGELREKLAVR